ncbi:MAG: HEAT repeat domain-containing protein [Kiritimatiellaceae bacterium]|nr:HEAT repeat domain-containing protein [Kiritimatiellaceae bacterium]
MQEPTIFLNKEDSLRPLSLSFLCWLIIVSEIFVLTWKILIYPIGVMGSLLQMRPLWNIPEELLRTGSILLHVIFLTSAIAVLRRCSWGRILLLALYPFSYVLSLLALGRHVEWWPFTIMGFCMLLLGLFGPASNRYFSEGKTDNGFPNMAQKLKVRIVMMIVCITLLGVAYWTLTGWAPKNYVGLVCLNEHISSGKLLENLTFSKEEGILSMTLLILHKKQDPCGLAAAIPLLRDRRYNVWQNAAAYLGSFGQVEAVPYLIKWLQTSKKTFYSTTYLQSITGEDFGSDFERWKAWWETQNPGVEFDWKANLRKSESGRSSKSRIDGGGEQ